MSANSAPGRILVVTPTWVGDVVMSQTVFMTLAERFPGVPIDALAPAWAHPLLGRMPQVDRCIPLPMGRGKLRMGAQYRVARQLAESGYGLAIVTRRAAKAALIPWLARIPERIGAKGEFRPFMLTQERSINSESHSSNVARLSAMAAADPDSVTFESAPWPVLAGHPDRGRDIIEAGFADQTGSAHSPVEGRAGSPSRTGSPRRLIAMAPGAAFGPAKRWPLLSWRTLAEQITAHGDRVVVVGSAAEASDADLITTGLSGATNLCGKTALAEVVDVMAACDVVVSNDSGLMHVAAAVDTRVVAIFGSTSPINTPPLSTQATSLWLGLDCSPCYAQECPLGHLRCLRDLTPAQVLQAVEGDTT